MLANQSTWIEFQSIGSPKNTINLDELVDENFKDEESSDEDLTVG